MRYRHALLAAASLWPVALPAGPDLECADAGSQVDIGRCVAQTEARVNRAIDLALGFARSAAVELDAVTGRDRALPALEAAQTAWSAYRDRQCEAVGAGFAGGSGTGIAIGACRVTLGRARVEELLDFAD